MVARFSAFSLRRSGALPNYLHWLEKQFEPDLTPLAKSGVIQNSRFNC